MSIWPNVVTGLCTLLAGFGGVGLTQRAAHRRWIDERDERHRIEQRNAIADVLALGSKWRTELYAMLEDMKPPAKGYEPGKEVARLHPSLAPEWTERHHEFARALLVAHLTVRDEEISELLSLLIDRNNDAFREWDKAVKANGAIEEEVAKSLRDDANMAIGELDAQARRMFGDPPARKRPK